MFKNRTHKNNLKQIFLDFCIEKQYLMVKYYLEHYKKYIDNDTVKTGVYLSISNNDEDIVDILLNYVEFNNMFDIRFHDICNKKIFFNILKIYNII